MLVRRIIIRKELIMVALIKDGVVDASDVGDKLVPFGNRKCITAIVEDNECAPYLSRGKVAYYDSEKLQPGEMNDLLGKPVVAKMSDGKLRPGRLVFGRKQGTFTIAPFPDGLETDQQAEWVSPFVMVWG